MSHERFFVSAGALQRGDHWALCGFARTIATLDFRFAGMLVTAGCRCILAVVEVRGVVLLSDGKNDQMTRRNEAFGTLRLLDGQRSLVLPLATIEAVLKEYRLL